MRSRPLILFLFLFLLHSPGFLHAAGVQGIPQLERNLLSREVMERSRAFISAMSTLEGHLDAFNRVLDLGDRGAVRSALMEVEKAVTSHHDLQAAASDLDGYLDGNRKRLRKEGLDSLLPLRDLTGRRYKKLDDAVADYLAARKKLLGWVEENFKALSSGNEEAARVFRSIFNECERKMEREKELYYNQKDLVLTFMHEHPELSEYLKK